MGINFKGGDKLEQKLREIAEKVGKANTVKVGFLEDATYSDGTPVALIAATNEYGGTVNVPEHDVTLHRKIDKNGNFAAGTLDEEGNRIGASQFVKTSRSNYDTVHHVEAYTITIPARPYFRGMIQKNKGDWGPQLGKIIKGADYDSAVALGRLGQLVKEQLQESIRDFSDPKNAKSTIAKKGFDKPLVEKSVMLNSADFEVNE
ncbi:hypothetical protein [Paraburkholderia elongata]|uniref:Uncharacterized protein n=1 Tax=Paraburkholderia elongata TaxID=2675747 RepID=A0A972SLC9_9BURK|nr:hypothetical protein [Paraburkholderia elongata]NPT59099.1 hypothetical protein [Paraburkholderia elongata]